MIGANFDKSKRSNFDSAVHVGFDSVENEMPENSIENTLGNKSSMQYFEETSQLKNLQKLKK